MLQFMGDNKKLLHTHEQKFAELEPEKGKPVIISTELTKNEERRLLQILKKYKEAIA